MSTELALQWDEGKYAFQKKLGNFVQFFQVNLPTNAYGVPLEIIDPLLLAEGADLLNCETTDDIPDAVARRAVLKVDFDDGIPLVEGTPIWERFDGEPVGYYKLFKEYREMLYSVGTRAITKLAATYNIVAKNLNALAKVYHWQLRARAYDLYKKQEYERRKQLEIQKLESKHSKVADRLLDQAISYLEMHPEQLNPKTALTMMQLAIKVGRISLGLQGDKPGTGDDVGKTNININQTVGPSSNAQVQESLGPTAAGGDTEQELSQLQSILHILDRSGALEKARSKVIEADFAEVAEEETTD